MELRIVGKGQFGRYYLEDENGVEHTLSFEFHGLKKQPEVDDIISINDKLLDKKYEGYSPFYAFGPLTGKFGREIKSVYDEDCLCLNISGEEIFLKRYYG